MSDRDMDRLFRQGSEGYDFEYDPEAWQDVEQRLDRRERRRRWLWWWFWGTGLALAVAIGIFYFSEKRQTKISDTTSPKTKIETTEETHRKRGTHPPVTEAETDLDVIGKQGDSLPGQNSPLEKQGMEPVPENDPQTPKNEPLPKKGKSFGEPPPVAAKSGGKVEWTPGRPIPKPTEAAGTPAEGTDPAHHELPVDARRAALSPMPHLPALPFQVFGKNGTSYIDLADLSFSENKNGGAIDVVPKKDHALTFGLSGAAEWNSAGFGDFSQQNWKVGLHATYLFQQKFGFSLGATWMRMDYDAGMGEYVPIEPGFWTDGIAPQSTFGICDMLELPVQFVFHLNGFRRDGLFFSAGLSSYWILEEHYWYNYDDPQPDFVFYWGTQKDERNWFNLGLFSLGYQKRLSPRTSLSFGPYAQFPLNGVGHGAVEIYSLGFRAQLDLWPAPQPPNGGL